MDFFSTPCTHQQAYAGSIIMSAGEAVSSSSGSAAAAPPGGCCIGVLALQGAFQEHAKILQELGVRTREVRMYVRRWHSMDRPVGLGVHCWDTAGRGGGRHYMVCRVWTRTRRAHPGATTIGAAAGGVGGAGWAYHARYVCSPGTRAHTYTDARVEDGTHRPWIDRPYCFVFQWAGAERPLTVTPRPPTHGYTPGGESTAMAIVGEQHGIFPRLKAFVGSGKPVRDIARRGDGRA